MKIQNVYLKKLNMNASVNHILSGSVSVPNDNNEYGKSMYSYKPVNFKGLDTIAFIGDLKSLTDMHCPLCGTKMLSQKEALQAMKEADEVNTPEEFCNYLEKYSENINPDFKNVIKDSKMQFYKNRSPEMQLFLEGLKSVFTKRTANASEKTYETINEILKDNNISEHDKKLINECKREIEYIIQKKSRTSLLKCIYTTTKNTMRLLQNEQKFEIYDKMTNPLKKALRQELLFEKGQSELSVNEPLQKTFLKNLLHFSKSDIHKVHSQKEAQDGSILNMMLSCEHCAAESKNLYKLKTTQDTRHYYQHLQELAKAALSGKLESNRAYPITLANFVRDTSKERLNPDDNDILLKQLSQITGVTKLRDVDFEIVSQKGIPCASCGQETITHDDKCELFDNIKNTSSMYGIAEIFNDNKNLIKPRYLGLVKRFNRLLIESHDITENEMLNNLRLYQYNKIKNALFECMTEVTKLSGNKNFNEYNKKCVNEYIEKTQNLLSELQPDEVFDYHQYRQITQESIGRIFDKDKNEIVISAKKPLKDLYLAQLLLFPDDEISQKVGSEIKVFAQDIFKSSVATVNNLDKTDKDIAQKDSKGKKVVFCKGCKTEKRTKDLKYWHKLHPEMEQNLLKYLRKVEELSKNRTVKGFEYYPYEVLENARILTDGEIDIPLSSL